MPKQSAYLKRLQLDKTLAIERDRLFTMQWCADAAILAANEVFKRRGEKLVEFALAMQRYSQEIASLTMADAKDDKDIEYTKAKVDAALKAILPENVFQPWDERYGG